MSFFIDVPTWCEQWRELEVLLFQFRTHFITRECQWHYNVHMISILKHFAIGKGSSRLAVLSKRSYPFPIWYAYCKRRGFKNLMFPLWFTLLGGSFVFLDMGPSILFLVFPLLWVLWFIYKWQGFIISWALFWSQNRWELTNWHHGALLEPTLQNGELG